MFSGYRGSRTALRDSQGSAGHPRGKIVFLQVTCVGAGPEIGGALRAGFLGFLIFLRERAFIRGPNNSIFKRFYSSNLIIEEERMSRHPNNRDPM